MNFKEMKERIKVQDVLFRYGVRLRTRHDDPYAGGPCPLPCHPQNDRKETKFYLHKPTNRWQCKNDTCKAKNGVGDLWGDCINLVAVLENTSFKDAAKLLEQRFGKENPAPHIAAPEDGKAKQPPPRHIPDSTSPALAVKGGYLHETGLWLDAVLTPLIAEEVIRKTLKKALMDRIHESFQNGKRSVHSLPV